MTESDPLNWTPEASALLQQVPFFARSQARRTIEDFARRHDYEEITADLVEKARQEFGQ